MTSKEMCRALADAIEGLTESERGALAWRSTTGTGAEWIDRLLYGVQAQTMIDDARNETALTALAADHQAEVDAIDLGLHGTPPPVPGVPAAIDPETGEIIVG
jgi:hypothetical protein